MRIEVTEEDIKDGIPFAVHDCPLARAISRATGKSVAVGLDQALIEGCVLAIDLPDDASAFYHSFDNRLPVTPIAFDLEVPT